jgi:CheY-like chemotaxis protein
MPLVSRILVVDDEESVAKGFERVLRSAGYATEWASNGLVALSMLLAFQFDAMLTDIFMPERDGFETIRELRKLYPALRIVVVSGGFDGDGSVWLRTALALGANAALGKPVSASDLLQCISSANAERSSVPALVSRMR